MCWFPKQASPALRRPSIPSSSSATGSSSSGTFTTRPGSSSGTASGHPPISEPSSFHPPLWPLRLQPGVLSSGGSAMGGLSEISNTPEAHCGGRRSPRNPTKLRSYEAGSGDTAGLALGQKDYIVIIPNWKVFPMLLYSRFFALSSLAVLTACGGNAALQVVPEPTAIGVEAALVSVVRGLRMAESEARSLNPQQSLGLTPCTVNVVFNITAGGINKNELVLDANIKGGNAVIGGGAEVKNTNTNELSASRGNQISLLLTSPACIPKDTLGTTHPTQVELVNQQQRRIRVSHQTPLLVRP